MRRVIGGAAVIALLAGCASAAGSDAPEPTAATVAVSASPGAEPEPEAAEPEPAALDAGALAEALAASVESATGFEVYTEDTDPNELLGRPGQYVSAASIDDEGAGGESGVDRGATIEVFASQDEARDRSEYILGVLKEAGPVFGTEWHHLAGPALLRVSGSLKPSVNDAYAAAWAEVTKG